VAQRVGRDRTFVTNYLRLLRLPEDIQKLVEENQISMGHARALLGVDDVEKQRQVAQLIIDRGLSVRETERTIKRIIAGGEKAESEPESLQFKVEDANVRTAETKLRRRFGTKVRILSNSNGVGGKIEIQYYDENDLHRIYELLNNSQEIDDDQSTVN
jgi:ParB family chromosome partitioning protein